MILEQDAETLENVCYILEKSDEWDALQARIKEDRKKATRGQQPSGRQEKEVES